MTSTETLQQIIARNVRERRLARGMTIDALAAAADISRRMLILIEGGATNPSVGVLDRLGQALGVGLPTLVGLPAQAEEAQVISPDAIPTIWRGTHPGSTARLAVATGPRGDVEMWEWRLATGEVFAAGVEPPGTQKLILVIEGTLMIRLGDATLRADAGHAARFPANQPHGYENHDATPVRFIGTVVFKLS